MPRSKTTEEYPFPRTLSRGVFAGRHFQTREEYNAAIRAHRDEHGPTRGRPGALNNHKIEKASGAAIAEVRRIVDSYDVLRSEGIGKEKAIQLIAQFSRRWSE